MEDDFQFATVEYRNGLYQGGVSEGLPSGMGLFLDDSSALYCSFWQKGICQGRTAVFLDKAKYFYG